LAKPVEPGALQMAVAQALRGEEASESAFVRERNLMNATRARAVAVAERLLAGIDLKSPAVARSLDRFAEWVASYFGYASAAFVFAQADQVLVAGTSRGGFVPSGTMLSGDTLYTAGVLGCGASLVLPDSAAYSPSLSQAGVRLLVAVPLVATGVPIGALCLVGREPHPFDAEDLLVLEHMGRDAAQALEHAARSRETPCQHFGFATPTLFDPLLSAELAILYREGGCAELLLADTDAQRLAPELGRELLARGGARSGICRRGNGTIAMFKRDPDPRAATRVIADALSMVSSVSGVQATGWVSVENRGLPMVPQQLLLQIAGLALDHSRSMARPEPERIRIAAASGAERIS
jgi:hypothetical protein